MTTDHTCFAALVLSLSLCLPRLTNGWSREKRKTCVCGNDCRKWASIEFIVDERCFFSSYSYVIISIDVFLPPQTNDRYLSLSHRANGQSHRSAISSNWSDGNSIVIISHRFFSQDLFFNFEKKHTQTNETSSSSLDSHIQDLLPTERSLQCAVREGTFDPHGRCVRMLIA